MADILKLNNRDKVDDPKVNETGVAHVVSTSSQWIHRTRTFLAILILFVNYFLSQYDKFILSYFRTSLPLTSPQYALVSGYATGIVYALLALPIAFVSDFTSSRSWVLFVCSTWWSLCVIFQSLVPEKNAFGPLFCARLGMGIGQSAVEALSISLISDLFAWRDVFLGNSIFYVGVYIGEAISGQIANAFVDNDAGWRIALRAVGITGIIVAVLLRLVLREPPRNKSIIQINETEAGKKDDKRKPNFHAVKTDIRATIVYLARMRSFWALVLSSSMRLLAGNVFGYYMPGYLGSIYPSISDLFSHYGIIVGVVGSVTVLSGGLICSLTWHKTKLTPVYLTSIGGMISSVFVLLMIFSSSIAGGNEQEGVKILYGVMSGAYLTAELWLGCFFSLIAMLLPQAYKTFGLAIWSSVQVLIYSSGPEIIGLALSNTDENSEAYRMTTRTALATIIVFGYWACGLGLLASIPLLKKDLRQEFVTGPYPKRRKIWFYVFSCTVAALVITLFTVSLVYGA